MEKFKKIDVKKIMASALLIWSAYLGHDKVQAQSETPVNPESPAILEGYSFADIFEQEYPELSEYELEQAIFEFVTELYDTIPEEGLSSEQIPEDLKALIFQSILEKISGHGENITATSENILRYFGRLNEDIAVEETTVNFDIRNLFDEDSITIQRFEEGGKKGVRILFDIDTKPLSDFVSKVNPEVLNASLTFGTQQIIIYTEELVPSREFHEVYIGSGNDSQLFYTETDSYGWLIDPSDNIARPAINGEFIRLYTEDELTENNNSSWVEISEANSTQIEPYFSRTSAEDGRYPGALDLGSLNRREVYELARSHPNTIFVAAAGNYNSNNEITEDKPSNLLFVGMYFQARSLIPGQSDIYILDTEINSTELRGTIDGQIESIDSASEATAVVSSLLNILAKENPELSPSKLINLFTNVFIEKSSGTYIIDPTDTTLQTYSINILRIPEVITRFSNIPVNLN